MQLHHLFESSNSLEPGEQRVPEYIKLKDLKLISKRIEELYAGIKHSEKLQKLFKQDTDLQQKMAQLQKRIAFKIHMLEKFQARPGSGQHKMFEILEQECSEFLPLMRDSGHMLYRGINVIYPQFEGRSRVDRPTKDSHPDISKKMDEMLAQMGSKALRSNSIYTTTNSSTAANFGNLYIIFPKNGFHFLSTNRADLILDKWNQIIDMDLVKPLWQDLYVWGEQHVPDWQNQQLAKYIKSEYWSDVFTIVKHHFDWLDNPMNLPERFNLDPVEYVTVKGIRDSFEPNTTDLVTAMESGKEILIHGEYWALRRDLWEDALHDRFMTYSARSRY